MFMNGAWTGTIQIIINIRQREIRKDRQMEKDALLAAAPGGIKSRSRDALRAAQSRPNIVMPTMAFASSTT
jgi:hypothetical protein